VSKHTFILNGERVHVECPGELRLLWVIRDILKVHGPKYGCGLDVCKACTCHINGKEFNPCSVKVSDVKPHDKITTIEGLPKTVHKHGEKHDEKHGEKLHPMQEAWIEYDVGQCGYCQPGQIMAAVAKVKQAKAEGRELHEKDFDEIRNICRCGTYHRIREAIKAGAKKM
jgi:isoquinoline 1-oxidoreductase subunit alpha